MKLFDLFTQTPTDRRQQLMSAHNSIRDEDGLDIFAQRKQFDPLLARLLCPLPPSAKMI